MSNKNSTNNHNEFKIEYQKYTLENDLEVVLHEDHRNPVVAVAIQYHVGSNRELPGKTGFAHLFEHLLFQRSEHVKRNEFFSKISDLGGNFNGGTWEDGTIYYESVPNDSLEKILWMESDRMGFFINTVTQAGLEREKDIVINEKRQTVDNQPYGHTDNVIKSTLYPPTHPYKWSVIGEMDDIRSATLEDVKEFYFKWYQPNNATICISGDFNLEETKALINKYFSEIKSNSKQPKNIVSIPTLTTSYRLMHEDKLANSPELTIVYPSPEQFSRESYALDLLCELLSAGKNSPMYKTVVDANIAPSVSINNYSREICGELTIRVRPYPEIKLDNVFNAITEGFKRFENEGIDPKELERIKNTALINFYRGISSNLNIAMNFAQVNTFTGSPDAMFEEPNILRSITAEDIIAVYNKYVKDKNFVATSFVPVGMSDFALTDSTVANVVEEDAQTQEVGSETGAIIDDEYPFSETTFDRTIEPPLGVLNSINIPDIWTKKLSNGLTLYGIHSSGIPMVILSLIIKVGAGNCNSDNLGVAYMTTKLLCEGTANKTPEELENAFRDFGVTLHANTFKEYIAFTISCLSENLEQIIQLLNEVITQPRWDENEFIRLKREAKLNLQISGSDSKWLGMNEFSKVIFGENPIAFPNEGTQESLDKMTLDDVKQFYNEYFSPTISDFLIAGDISQQQVEDCFEKFIWAKKDIQEIPVPKTETKSETMNYIDYPDGKQTFIMVGRQAMSRNHPDYIPAYVANYKLGDGSGGELFKVLRLERGYTYGAYSFVMAARNIGSFRAYSSVQATTTQESINIFKEIILNYPKNYTEEDMKESVNAIIRQESCNYETLSHLLDMLSNIAVMKLPLDYVNTEIQRLKSLTFNQVKESLNKYFNIDDMKFVIVGDYKITKENILKNAEN